MTLREVGVKFNGATSLNFVVLQQYLKFQSSSLLGTVSSLEISAGQGLAHIYWTRRLIIAFTKYRD